MINGQVQQSEVARSLASPAWIEMNKTIRETFTNRISRSASLALRGLKPVVIPKNGTDHDMSQREGNATWIETPLASPLKFLVSASQHPTRRCVD